MNIRLICGVIIIIFFTILFFFGLGLYLAALNMVIDVGSIPQSDTHRAIAYVLMALGFIGIHLGFKIKNKERIE